MPKACGGVGRSPSRGIASRVAKTGVSESSGMVTESGATRIAWRNSRFATMLSSTEASAGPKYPGTGPPAPCWTIQAANSGTDPIVSRKTSATGGISRTSSLRVRSNPAQPSPQATMSRRTGSGMDIGAGV